MKYLRHEPLKKHTSFRIGGPADYFCVPKDLAELREAFDFAAKNRLPLAVMGWGTNLLVLDKGFHGLVVKLGGGFSKIIINGRQVQGGAGILLSALIKVLTRKHLAGLEFLAGIPGTLGGAVVMNAGAWGKAIGDFVDKITVVDDQGQIKVLGKRELKFGYRRSLLQKKNWTVAEVVLKLRKGKLAKIKEKIRGFLEQRRANQPLGIPNAGSIFKNPPGKFAGQLLEEAGFKGMRIGDAQVSAKHANFIVNLGEAKAADVLKLITRMQNAVLRKFKVKLEPELKIMVQSNNDFQRSQT